MAGEFLFVQGLGVQVVKAELFRLQDFDVEQSDIRSYLGTPVFDQVIIAEGQYFEIQDVSKENPIPFESLTLQTVLLEVSQTKNIVTTALQGRNGTIKEYVADGDFAITMTGGVIGEMDTNGNVQDIGNFYPEVDTKRLVEICKVPNQLTITSNFLQLFGINEVVITSYNINQQQGTRNLQPFVLNLLSDNPIDLDELAIV